MGMLDGLLGRIFGGSRTSGLTAIHRGDESTMLGDAATVAYMASSHPDPTQDDLDALFARTVRAIVRQDGVADGDPLSEQILIEEREPEGIAELRAVLRIEDGGVGHCMCFGDPSIELLNSAAERVAVLGVHHGHSIRWDGWRDDAALSEGMSLLNWLADRGVRGPLEQHREAIRVGERNHKAWIDWLTAAPDCLRPILPKLGYTPLPEDEHHAIAAALALQFPNPVERIGRLFEWYGSGSPLDTPMRAYEGVAEEILMRLPMPELVAGIAVEPSRAALDGALRLFAGWHFSQERAGEVADLSGHVRARLLAHAEGSISGDDFERVLGRLGGGAS